MKLLEERIKKDGVIKEGNVVKSVQYLAKGDSFSISLSDGSIHAVVEEVLPNGSITEKL